MKDKAVTIDNKKLTLNTQNIKVMPHLDSTGPEGKGPATGRGLGPCKDKKKSKWPLGIGMGKRRKLEDGGEGMGKRIRSGNIFDKEE